jgi:hypothetical protein
MTMRALNSTAIIVLVMLFLCAGCDWGSRGSTPRDSSQNAAEYQRFQLVQQQYGYGLALDTKTGQLCHTFNAKLETYTSPRPGTAVVAGQMTLDHIPLCIDLGSNENATVERILSENRGKVKAEEPRAISTASAEKGKKESDEEIMKRLIERYGPGKPAQPKPVRQQP